MDKKKGLINVIVSIIFKIILLVSGLLVRRFLIQYIGNEANGLYSLYNSIIGFLAVAELGVGSAITFCMYKPIVNGETQKVSALYNLFTKLYLIIGGVILAGGLIVMPFLPYFAKDYQSFEVNLYLTFGIMLLSTLISYLFSSKTSLINAYKNNYITTTINSVGMLIQYVLQIIVIIYTKSFFWYLICHIIAIAIQWVATEIIARIKYSGIMKDKSKIDNETKHSVVKNVKALFMHRIGGALVNTTDSIIISAFIGVVILGKYSNYTTIMISMTGVISLFFTPLTSIIGHLCAKGDLNEINKYYNFFYAFNFAVGTLFFLGYYGTIDNLITLLFGDGLEMSKMVSAVITVNYFVQFMRQATLLFRDATGTFYYDRWKPIFEGILNVILSIGFVYLGSWIFGAENAVIGVILATIVVNLLICYIIEPHVLYKYALHRPAKNFYIKNYSCIILFVLALITLNYCMISSDNQIFELLINGCISICISIIPTIILTLFDKDFRYYLSIFIIKIKNKITKA